MAISQNSGAPKLRSVDDEYGTPETTADAVTEARKDDAEKQEPPVAEAAAANAVAAEAPVRFFLSKFNRIIR